MHLLEEKTMAIGSSFSFLSLSFLHFWFLISSHVLACTDKFITCSIYWNRARIWNFFISCFCLFPALNLFFFASVARVPFCNLKWRSKENWWKFVEILYIYQIAFNIIIFFGVKLRIIYRKLLFEFSCGFLTIHNNNNILNVLYM